MLHLIVDHVLIKIFLASCLLPGFNRFSPMSLANSFKVHLSLLSFSGEAVFQISVQMFLLFSLYELSLGNYFKGFN
jgi:hypothetical protein